MNALFKRAIALYKNLKTIGGIFPSVLFRRKQLCLSSHSYIAFAQAACDSTHLGKLHRVDGLGRFLS